MQATQADIQCCSATALVAQKSAHNNRLRRPIQVVSPEKKAEVSTRRGSLVAEIMCSNSINGTPINSPTKRHIEVLHEFQNTLLSPETSTKLNSIASSQNSKKSQIFEDEENSSNNLEMSPTTIASRLRSSSLTGSNNSELAATETDEVLRKDSMSVSATTTNKN